MSKFTLEDPIDLIKLSIGEKVLIKLKGNRELKGQLHAFDQHLNLILENAEETLQQVELNEKNEHVLTTKKRKIQMLFVRGDGIILISPPVRTT